MKNIIRQKLARSRKNIVGLGEKVMKEIKFRLVLYKKIVGYEKWYGGRFSETDGQTADPCWLYSKDNKNWNPNFIWHKQKNQYTGRRDKNDKEIYEGDD